VTLRVAGQASHSDTCQRGHEWTPENTIISSTDGKRRCRTCQKASKRARRRYADKELFYDVKCPSCDVPRRVTARTERRIRSGENSGWCDHCRYQTEPKVTEELKQWWLERYTLDEIQVLGRALATPAADEWHDTVPTIEVRAA
jgi:hypothetical protein